MIASLLSKIYIKSSETEPIADNQISNIITCSNYNWNLNKDIVISTNYSGDNKSLLSLNGINYKEYYNQLSHWISSNTKDNSFNILINLNKLKQAIEYDSLLFLCLVGCAYYHFALVVGVVLSFWQNLRYRYDFVALSFD